MDVLRWSARHRIRTHEQRSTQVGFGVLERYLSMAKAPKDDIDPGVLWRSARRAAVGTFRFFEGGKAGLLFVPVVILWFLESPKFEWSALTSVSWTKVLITYGLPAAMIFIAHWVMAAWYQGTQRLSDHDPEYARAIGERETFTLVEAAYLLAGLKIQSGEMTGTALVILQDLKAKVGERRIKATKQFELQITMETMMTTGGANGRPKVGGNVEITADTLTRLARKRGVAIPGLTGDVRKVSA